MKTGIYFAPDSFITLSTSNNVFTLECLYFFLASPNPWSAPNLVCPTIKKLREIFPILLFC